MQNKGQSPKTNRNRKSRKEMKKNLSLFLVLILIVVAFIAAFGFLLSPKGTSTEEVLFEIKQGEYLTDISSNLQDAQLIRNKDAFEIYVKLHRNQNSLQAGLYSLNESMDLKEIMNIFVEGNVTDTMTLTIREGMDMNRIGDYLEEEGFCTKEKFLSEANDNFDYYKQRYDFLKDIPPKRENRLEGYLFADTYEVYQNSTPRDIILKMLDRTDLAITDEYKNRAKELGITLDDAVTMASLVEREGILDSELPRIAGVFYNRLEKDMLLQSCATLQYIYKDYQFTFSAEQMRIDNPYNTYRNVGLPAGPISNFRESALKAALYPEENDYLYFCSKNDGTGSSAFAKTLSEHEKNIEKYSGNWE